MNPPIPTFPDPDYQARQDAEQLRLLSIFYYVMAGILAVTGLIFIVHIIMGLTFVGAASTATSGVTFTPNTFPGAPPFPKGSVPPGFPSGSLPPSSMPSSFGWIFVFMGTFALTVSEVLALLTFLAGRALAKREKKTLIQVVAALLCLHVPLGTALGVFTFIVLGRPSVAPQFDSRS